MAILQLEGLSPFMSSLDTSTTTRSGVLQKVAEWVMESIPEAVGLLKNAGSKIFL